MKTKAQYGETVIDTLVSFSKDSFRLAATSSLSSLEAAKLLVSVTTSYAKSILLTRHMTVLELNPLGEIDSIMLTEMGIAQTQSQVSTTIQQSVYIIDHVRKTGDFSAFEKMIDKSMDLLREKLKAESEAKAPEEKEDILIWDDAALTKRNVLNAIATLRNEDYRIEVTVKDLLDVIEENSPDDFERLSYESIRGSFTKKYLSSDKRLLGQYNSRKENGKYYFVI